MSGSYLGDIYNNTRTALTFHKSFTILQASISWCTVEGFVVVITAGITVNFLNIRTPKKFVVITLEFELCGSIIE